jgi:hypothetical protein
MSAYKGISEKRNNNIKETRNDEAKLHQAKEEFSISKNNMQNSVIGLDKEIVQGKKFL